MTRSINIVRSFRANTFRPTNFITANCHWQTIVGSGSLHRKFFGKKPPTFSRTSEVIDTPDGDFFEVDYTKNIESADSIVIVMHGLESHSKVLIINNFAAALLEKGFACCLINFRGCTRKIHK